MGKYKFGPVTICEFWISVLNNKDGTNENLFDDLVEFAISVLVLPFSNAVVEGLSSHMNLIKSKIRNKMQTAMLNAIL
jgi:hypothetical protein